MGIDEGVAFLGANANASRTGLSRVKSTSKGLFIMGTSIGTPEQWEQICQRHPGLREALNTLIEYSPTPTRPVTLSSDAHKIVFGLRNVCIEECWEILLLAAHSYEKGATKLLRGLYEPLFPQLLLSAYIVPTLFLHTTMASAWSRVTSDAGKHTFSYTPNPQQIDSCIFHAFRSSQSFTRRQPYSSINHWTK